MSAASRATVAVTGAITTILVARLLGPEGSGAFYVAQSAVLLLTVAMSLGVEHGIAYFVANGSWGSRSALVTALRFAAVTGVVGATVGMAARLLVPDAFAGLEVWMTAVTVFGLPFWLGWFYATYVALASDRYEAFVLPPALQSTLMMLLAGAGAVAFGIGGAVAGMTVATVAVGIGAIWWGLRRLPRSENAEPPGRLRKAISFGIKGYAANALQMVNYRIDIFILAATAAGPAVGHYSVAVAATSLLLLVPQALSEVLFPRVAALSASDHADSVAHREMVEVKGLRHVTLAVTVMAALLAVAVVLLIVPVFGREFRPAVELGLLLVPGVAVNGIAAVLSATVVGRGKPIYSLYTVLITTPPTIVLYATLIPWLGATGAALGSSLSYTATFLVACFWYRRLTGRRVLRTLVPTRSEVADLLALPRATLAWAAGRRAGR